MSVDGPHYIINAPVSATRYYAPQGYGAIPSNGTTVTAHCKAWSGANGTGSGVTVTTLEADAYNVTGNSDHTFSGNFASVTANGTAGNSTDWWKPAGKFTGAQSVGSLEIWLTYTGSAFIPTTPTFSPSNGAIADSITVSGTHFTDATSVTFNGTSASFTVTNDTTISATVPAGATTGPIVVGNPSGTGTSATNFVVNSGGTVNIYAYDGSTQQQVTAIYAYDGAAWQQCSVYVYDGATWQQVA